jgi:hypothetical protein
MSGDSEKHASFYRTVALIVAVAAVPLLLRVMAQISVNFAAAVAFGVSDPPGPMPSVRDWPVPLQDLHQELLRIHSTGFDAYLLDGKPGPDSVREAVFRISASKPILQQVVKRLNLVIVDSNNDRIAGWGDLVVSMASKEWWPPTSAIGVDHFASQPLLDGDEGDLYIAAFDKTSEQLFILYQFNF